MNEEHAEKVYMIREVTAIQKLNMDVQAASDRLATIESGDILVTATTATEPIIHGAEIKKGVYVAHLGDNEVDEELILRADKVVIDDWETDKHRVGDTMAYMFRDGKIDDSRIDASVSDLVTGRKSGRDNDDQLTYTCNVGLGLYDVAIAARVYQYAKGNGIGPEAQALGRAHHGVIDPNLIGTTSLYQPFGQVRFLAGLSTFFRGRAVGEMHLQGDFAFTEDDSVNIMDADKIWRRCEKAALR